MSKTARLEVAIYMLEERIKSLEEALRSIAQISQETLQEKNERDPQP
jgi:proteasome assembly chaperone (PAC2) family protein